MNALCCSVCTDSSLWAASSFLLGSSNIFHCADNQLRSGVQQHHQRTAVTSVTHLTTPGLFLRYLLMIYSRRSNEICKRHWSTGKSWWCYVSSYLMFIYNNLYIIVCFHEPLLVLENWTDWKRLWTHAAVNPVNIWHHVTFLGCCSGKQQRAFTRFSCAAAQVAQVVQLQQPLVWMSLTHTIRNRLRATHPVVGSVLAAPWSLTGFAIEHQSWWVHHWCFPQMRAGSPWLGLLN